MGNRIVLLAIFALLSIVAYGQNVPSGAIWGNSKIPLRTAANDSAGYADLTSLKAFFNQGLGSGTVTSVALTVPTGLSVTGSPITSSGTFAITNNLSAGYVSSSGVAGNFTSSATIPTTALSGTITNAQLAGSIDLTTKVTGVLPVANGGSGVATITGYLKGNGTADFTGSSTIPTSDLSGTISNAQLQNSTVTVAAGTAGADVAVSGSPVALGGTVTINIPDAGASSRGVITTGTQTIAGAKTLTGAMTSSGGLTSSGLTTASGGLVFGVTAVSSATTLTTAANIVKADATSAAFAITLPTTPANGTRIKVIKTNATANYVTLTRGGTNTINGNNNFVIVSNNMPITLYFDTATWYVE